MATVRVPILNLFSGVARQPSAKRLTSELQEVDNAILTLERSAEKRPSLEFIHGGSSGGFLGSWVAHASPNSNNPDLVDDIAYFFFDKSTVERYIIIINRGVDSGSTDLIKIFKFREYTTDDLETTTPDHWPHLNVGDIIIEEAFDSNQSQTITFSDVTTPYTNNNHYIPDSTLPSPWNTKRVDDIWEYVKWNPEGKPARDCLKATFFGSAVMILNNQVPACTWTTADPASPSVLLNGKKLTYRVAATPEETGDYAMGGPYNPDTDRHEPVGGHSASHQVALFAGADGNGTIELSKFLVNNLNSNDELGMVNITGSTYTTIAQVVSAINSCTVVNDSDGASQGSFASNYGTFYLDEDSGSSTPPGTGPYTGKLWFKTTNNGTDIVQFFDGNGRTCTHLGLTGTNSVFDAARKTGKNMQPFIAAAAGDPAANTCPLNSLGGPPDNADEIKITSGTTETTWQLENGLDGDTDTWGDVRDHLESETSNKYTLALNSDRTGSYIVHGSSPPAGEVSGTIPDKVEDETGNYARRMGWLYDIGMHKPVRDDVQISSDIFENELGQNISSFNAIEIPPEGDDVNRVNGEEEAIDFLYGGNNGFGKVWYCRSGFLTFPQGFYRCVDNNTIPHYDKVRTEDEHSVFYEPSFPFLIVNGGNNTWNVEYPKWTPRESGTANNNPGPQAFNIGDKKGIIKDIAFWRERLWFAVDDMVFSSRNNDWFDLWLGDPNNITSEDPIDIRASSGKYTRINFMIPFDDFLFINTGGETQYELQGSNNIISPTTAELAPTSFYSASGIVEPLVLGTQIYWFDDERLYLYNSSAGTSVNNTTEVSIHANGYLPKNYRCACVAPAQDSIFVVDEDNPDHLYVYTARWAGGEIAQNSFYRYVLPQTIVDRQISGSEGWELGPYWSPTDEKTTLPKPEIEYIWYSRNYLYMIVIRPAYEGAKMQRFIERTSLQFLDINTPRLDRLMEVENKSAGGTEGTDDTWYTDPNTYWRLPYWDPGVKEVVLGPEWPTQSGQRIASTATITNLEDGTLPLTQLRAAGNWDAIGNSQYTSFSGSTYTMKLELSKINYRDPSSGVPVEGTLALRMMNIKHFKTGVYDIEITRNQRTALGATSGPTSTTTHTPLSINNSPDALGALLVEEEGEFTTRIFGNADTTKIAITSDYPTPVAITGMEFIGKFKPYNASIQS